MSFFTVTYLRPSLPVEHRPSMTPRHRTLFWAALVIPLQLVPCCFSSASVSRLQLSLPLWIPGQGLACGAGCWLPEGVSDQPHFSAVCAWPLVAVQFAPTDLYFGSSLANGFCRCASHRYWRMSGSYAASSVLSAMSHIRKAGLTVAMWLLKAYGLSGVIGLSTNRFILPKDLGVFIIPFIPFFPCTPFHLCQSKSHTNFHLFFTDESISAKITTKNSNTINNQAKSKAEKE